MTDKNKCWVYSSANHKMFINHLIYLHMYSQQISFPSLDSRVRKLLGI